MCDDLRVYRNCEAVVGEVNRWTIPWKIIGCLSDLAPRPAKSKTVEDSGFKKAFVVLMAHVLMTVAATATAQNPMSSSDVVPKEKPAYPSMPIRLIVPYPAGGPSDLAARVVAELLGTDMKQNVIVLNRSGGGGSVGMQALAASKSDGYSIGLATSALISNKYITLAPVDYTKLSPLALMFNSPGALVVKDNAPWRNVKDLIRYAKDKGGDLRIGNTGAGATWDLMGLIVKDKCQIAFTAVPYNGGAPLVVAVIGGEIEAGLQSVSGWAPNVKSGKLRFIAIASEERDSFFPEVRTFRENDIDLVYGLWSGFLAPKGTPDDIVKKLSEALHKLTRSARLLDFANSNGFSIEVKGPADFERFLKAEDERIGTVAKKYDLSAK